MKQITRCAAALLLCLTGAVHAEQYRMALPCVPAPGLLWIAHSAARAFMFCATNGLSGHLVDIPSGKPLLSTQFEEIRSSILAVSYSADGSTFAVMTVDGTGVLYSLEAPPRTLAAGRPGLGVSFVSGNRLLAMNLSVWELGTEAKALATLGGDFGAIRDAALAPGGRVAAMAGEDTTVRLYDAASWESLHEIRSSYTTPRAVAFSLDARLLFVGGLDRRVRRYDAQSGMERGFFSAAGLVTDLFALPDGRSLAVQTEAMMGVPPATWEIVDIESGNARPCAADRAANGLAVIDGTTWCFSVQDGMIDAWTR